LRDQALLAVLTGTATFLAPLPHKDAGMIAKFERAVMRLFYL
jgi:hypothetical protein